MPVEGDRLRARARQRRDRRDHVVHEHVEPAGDGRRRPAGEEGRRARPEQQAVGQDEPGAGLAGRDRLLRARRPDGRTSSSSASTPSATAARPASATPARCRRRSRSRSSEGDLVVCSVLSGNRNFEARIHPEVKANYLASPPLVVAYALAGRMDIDLTTEPLGQDAGRQRRLPARHLADVGRRSRTTIASSVRGEMFRSTYADVFTGDEHWREPAGARGRALRLGAGLDLRPPAAVLRGHAAGARAGRGHRRRALPRHARRLGHDRPHLAGRRDQARLARPASTCSSTASSARTSTPTARAAATTR